MDIAVLGAGAWGTAIACAASSRNSVTLFARDPTQAAAMRQSGFNRRYLPDVALPESLTILSDLASTLRRADDGLVVVATPMRAMREVVRELRHGPRFAHATWLGKGFEESTERLGHEIVAEEFSEKLAQRCGPLSGPSFALEVAQGLPTALTVAGTPELCECVTTAMHGESVRIYSTDDVIGVEIGGAVKNVLAIATGISDSLGLGLNARAALITRGAAEMTRLGVASGARAETFMGLTGIGDLILTATGDLSRNRRVGLALGRGLSVHDAIDQLGHVAEGVRSAHSVLGRARATGIEMPITEAVCAVIDGAWTPAQALDRLLAREPKPEAAQ